jgi:hypothetical protein
LIQRWCKRNEDGSFSQRIFCQKLEESLMIQL